MGREKIGDETGAGVMGIADVKREVVGVATPW
jgi:hypothetical protein